MGFEVIKAGLDGVIGAIHYLTQYTKWTDTKSLPEVTKLTRVEPLSIISKDLVNLEQLQDVQTVLLSLFCGYYLQAVSLFTKVHDVEVVKILDRLNPDRDHTAIFYSLESARTWSLEAYQYALPTRANYGLEDNKIDENIKALNEVASLSVGKQLDVKICYDHKVMDGSVHMETEERMVNVPVTVRLLASLLSEHTINSILVGKGEDKSMVERFHAWRSGRISFIKDLILCQDLIDESKRAMIGDETGTMAEIMRRVTNSKKYGLLTQNPSMVSASNLFTISKEIAQQIEHKMGGRLSNANVRRRVFDNTYAMIIAVVDRDFERVQFYTRGVAAPTDVSFKDIKASSKGKGPDVMDIMKAMNGMPGPLSI